MSWSSPGPPTISRCRETDVAPDEVVAEATIRGVRTGAYADLVVAAEAAGDDVIAGRADDHVVTGRPRDDAAADVMVAGRPAQAAPAAAAQVDRHDRTCG